VLSAESGLDAITRLSNQPSGELRVTAPAFVTQTGLMDSFAEFATANTGVKIKFNFSDHPRDLIRDEFDIAIRAGRFPDSELMSRNIGRSSRILVASPEYVNNREPPALPENLEEWDWLHFSMRPEKVEMISESGESTSVSCKYRIEVDAAYALNEFALRGLGITPLPENLANRGIRQGTLVRIMPEWSLAPLELHAVWPDRSRRESLTLMFVRFLVDKSANM